MHTELIIMMKPAFLFSWKPLKKINTKAHIEEDKKKDTPKHWITGAISLAIKTKAGFIIS